MTSMSGGGGRRARWFILTLIVIVLSLSVETAVTGNWIGGLRAKQGKPVAQKHSKATDRNARSVPGSASADAAAVRATAVRDLLNRRGRALVRKDRSAFFATIDPASKAFRSKQAAYFANLVKVPFGTWTYELEGGIEGPSSGSQFQRYFAPVWVPHVRVHYTLAGYDRAPTVGDAYFTFVKRGSKWLIGSDSDVAKLGFTTTREFWDFGPVNVVRGTYALVLGHPKSNLSLRTMADEIDRDVPRVNAAWGTSWSQRVVALVPSTQRELSRILSGAGDLNQIAAVATAELEGDEASKPVGDRVIVNPPNFTKLGPLGRRVVITHEITHVATRQATSDLVPTWLVEGIADYVGYKDTGVPVSVAASELRRDLQRGNALGSLPTDAAYSGSNKKLAQAYEKSWLACKYIAEKFGQATLMRFYRVVGAHRSGTETSAIDRSLRTVLHLTLKSFTAQWAAYVRAQLA
jgi:hypothetical protein